MYIHHDRQSDMRSETIFGLVHFKSKLSMLELGWGSDECFSVQTGVFQLTRDQIVGRV